MSFETWPMDAPEGGTEMAERPTVKDPNVIPVAYGRDAQTDARSISEAGSGNIMDDRDLDDTGYQLDLNVTSIGREKRRGGWQPIDTPFGGPPPPVTTSGSRGADDIGPYPDDGSMP